MQADADDMKPTGYDSPAGAGTTDFDLEHFLPYRLSVLTNTISEGLARRYRDLQPLSVTEWRILAVLGRFPGLVASDVCERTAMDKVAISRAVRSLMEKGMLDRQQDRGDRRKRRLFVSPGRGQRVLKQVVPVALQYERRLVESLDAGEVEVLSRIMQTLLRRSKDLDAD
jgi:DNA-binding MarR family transcriptional regulator